MDDIINIFERTYKCSPTEIFSCGGRFEILGNHTDHNHGLCLAATCNLAIKAAVAWRTDLMVNMVSIGYRPFSINLLDLSPKEEERNYSCSLVRGIAYYLCKQGYRIGGFDAVTASTIFPGAGVSSSAAFELLIGEIFNVYFNEGKIDKMTLCKAGQFAENNYFGKKSGLLDQIGVGYGNIVSIDFKNIEKPIVSQVNFPFSDLHFVIVNTGGSHAELSHLYSSIPEDMINAAKKCGHRFLREGSMDEITSHRRDLFEMEYNRALHYYGENERVKAALDAIKYEDQQLFLDSINGSRMSSTYYLKNMMVDDEYEGSPLEACDLAMEIMENEGACKINGGGFAGSIICVVPTKHLENFIFKMGEKYGEKNVCEVFVREYGPIKEKSL